MRVLWIGKACEDAAAGNEIYDRRMIAALRDHGFEIDVISPQPVSPARELANLARGIPHYRARYGSSANRALLAVAARYPIAVCSWEPFDMLAHALACPVIPILHNITSRSLRSMYPTNPVAKLLAMRAAQWERDAYGGGRFAATVVLSRADEAYVCSIAPAARIIYAPPGLPPVTPLSPNARFVPEMVIAGTFDWRAKRRDILRLASEWQAGGLNLKVVSDPLPETAAAKFRATSRSLSDNAAAIRIGVVPDRFEAGHKLKVGAYIANNAMVLSFADPGTEYRGIEDAGYFIRQIQAVDDIRTVASELAAVDPEQLRRRWLAFQVRVQHQFCWHNSMTAIASALVEVAGKHP
ncbi:MAG TPA: hypothetical protein VGO70_09125 [Arsenicitalea sp.]|jgi:hypothetical protein|nr:hypothetical protein [Arsenicitalea sp.]